MCVSCVLSCGFLDLAVKEKNSGENILFECYAPDGVPVNCGPFGLVVVEMNEK